MKRAVIYTRASLDATGEGRSVERQETACRQLAELRGWDVVEVRSDNSISAYGGKRRPGWESVLDLVDRGAVDVVVVWHLDRATRSMADLEKLIERVERSGVGLATASGDIDLTTDVGRMVARILAAVARAEVERKAARQKLANEQKALTGAPSTGGARPFGYARNHVDVVPEEAEAIRWGAARALEGVSMRAIGDEWERRGLRSSRADEMGSERSWSTRGVRGVLISPRYAGIRSYLGAEVGKGAWEAIIDEETHRALVRLITDPARLTHSHKAGAKAANLMTSLASCGVCGAQVRASAVRGAPVYTCRSGGHVYAPRADVDAFVAAQVIARVSQPDFLASLAPTGDAEADEARAKAKEARERLEALAEAFAEGAITKEQLSTASRRLRGVLDAADGALSAARRSPALAGLAGVKHVAAAWAGLGLERQRAAVEALFEIVVQPGGVGCRAAWKVEEKVQVRDRVLA